MFLTRLFPKQRPYWHVDLKWVCGILLFFAVGATLLLYNLSVLTERERATTISATIIASLFSKDGLDDEKDVIAFREKAATMPGEVLTPIPMFPTLQVSKTDLANKSPRELRILIFKQLTDPIYDKGLSGAAEQFTTDAASREQFKKDAALLGIFTKGTHEKLSQAFTWSAVAAGILLLLLLYFSSGWGRLVSPGLVLLFASPLGTVLSLLLLHPPKDGDAPFANLPESVAREIGTSLQQSYATATLIGVSLLLIAALGKLIQKFIHHTKPLKK